MGRTKTDGYSPPTSKKGEIVVHLLPPLASEVDTFCKIINKNRTTFVTECVEEQLKALKNDVFSLNGTYTRLDLLKILNNKK